MMYKYLTGSVCFFGKMIKTSKGDYEILTIEKVHYLFCVLLHSVQCMIEACCLRGCPFVTYQTIIQKKENLKGLINLQQNNYFPYFQLEPQRKPDMYLMLFQYK